MPPEGPEHVLAMLKVSDSGTNTSLASFAPL